MDDENKMVGFPEPKEARQFAMLLSEEHMLVMWWALFEKKNQLLIRINQYKQSSWPPEAISAAQWEVNKIEEVLTLLSECHTLSSK
jgi:hypothetical protein